MHGSTKRMVDHLTDALIERGISVKQFDLTRTDIENWPCPWWTQQQ
jgi:flavorubredoxin